MKKTYINPAMEIYSIDAQQQLLAGSMQGNWSTDADPGSAESFEFDFEEEF